jgi:hypothetical protein
MWRTKKLCLTIIELDPDPCSHDTAPKIRIRVKILRIRNNGKQAQQQDSVKILTANPKRSFCNSAASYWRNRTLVGSCVTVLYTMATALSSCGL